MAGVREHERVLRKDFALHHLVFHDGVVVAPPLVATGSDVRDVVSAVDRIALVVQNPVERIHHRLRRCGPLRIVRQKKTAGGSKGVKLEMYARLLECVRYRTVYD